jgi:Smg protein
LALERTGILSPQQREIVIERLLALESAELDVDQLKWVALMVLSSQPGEELACERMEDIVFDLPYSRPH